MTSTEMNPTLILDTSGNSHSKINIHIIAMTPLQRYDLPVSSCVNKEIQVFNRKLHKLLKDMHHVTIIETNLTRNEFTQHGLHMNSLGKEDIAKIIGHNITIFRHARILLSV